MPWLSTSNIVKTYIPYDFLATKARELWVTTDVFAWSLLDLLDKTKIPPRQELWPRTTLPEKPTKMDYNLRYKIGFESTYMSDISKKFGDMDAQIHQFCIDHNIPEATLSQILIDFYSKLSQEKSLTEASARINGKSKELVAKETQLWQIQSSRPVPVGNSILELKSAVREQWRSIDKIWVQVTWQGAQIDRLTTEISWLKDEIRALTQVVESTKTSLLQKVMESVIADGVKKAWLIWFWALATYILKRVLS